MQWPFRIGAAALAALAFASFAAPLAAASEPTGVWIDHTGRGAVEITRCGEGLCGRLVWFKDSSNNGACGLQIIGEVRPVKPGVWDKGWIFDPEVNKRFDVELTALGSTLKVVGYLGSKLLSETMVWKRAPADLKLCGT